MARVCAFCGKKASLGFTFWKLRDGGCFCGKCIPFPYYIIGDVSGLTTNELAEFLNYRNAYEGLMYRDFQTDFQYGRLLLDAHHGLFALVPNAKQGMPPVSGEEQIFEIRHLKAVDTTIRKKTTEDKILVFNYTLEEYDVLFDFTMAVPSISIFGFEAIHKQFEIPDMEPVFQILHQWNPNLGTSNDMAKRQEAEQEKMVLIQNLQFLEIPPNEKLTPELLTVYKNRKISSILNTTNDYNEMDKAEAAAAYVMQHYRFS